MKLIDTGATAMRAFFLLLLSVLLLQQATAETGPPALSGFLERADDFFSSFVVEGQVDYHAIKDKPEQLNGLLSLLAATDPATLTSEATGKAFWINAYNICTINAIVESYPLSSPQDRPRFFEKSGHLVAGEIWSLNEIEHRNLQNRYQDPRIHFAIVCAAVGCPPLISEAYKQDRIEAQLDERARAVINDPRWIRVDHETGIVHGSKIFDWYRDEFQQEAGTLLDFLNEYRIERIPTEYSIEFIPYDWQLNDSDRAASGTTGLQAYTPGKLLLPGQIEAKEFWNLYTQTAYFDENGDRQDQDSRSTYFTATTTILYGIARHWNLGFDLYFKSVLNANDPDSSPFEILSFSSDDNARTALTTVAPKVKISPIGSIPSFSLQTSIVVPLTGDLEDDPFLDYDGVQWWTQLFYDYYLSEDLLLYFEGDFFWRLDTGIESETVSSPIKTIVHYYPSNQWVVYGLAELAPSWDGGERSAYYTQFGLGVKHQLLPYLELEFLATIFPIGENKGAGSTLNLGVRWLE